MHGRALALRLFENRHLTLVQAARLAGGAWRNSWFCWGIPVADYPAEELDEEVGTAS